MKYKYGQLSLPSLLADTSSNYTGIWNITSIPATPRSQLVANVPKTASYLITVTSRGIGLELSRALAAKPASEVSIVFAAYRTKTAALEELVSSSAGRVEAVPMDATSEGSIKKAAGLVERSLAGKGLDVLVNNAGQMPLTPGGIQTMGVVLRVTSLENPLADDMTKTIS